MNASHDIDRPSRWVFGYGSLIWRPGFDYISARPALLRGAHRSLCIYSHRYRGTPERPGLVFGLMPGGSCHGMAFEVADRHWEEVRAYLHEREQTSGVYRESVRRVRLAGGEPIEALVFLVNPAHAQYAGRLDLDQQMKLIRHAAGEMGANVEYVINTLRHFEELGIHEPYLAALAARLNANPDGF